jgi:phospholipase C
MIAKYLRRIAAFALFCGAAGLIPGVVRAGHGDQDDYSSTKTPIKHVVVIFQENVSFDHYFGTYPYALPNKDGSVYFHGPAEDTPRANTLIAAGLLTNNPNSANPFRIDRSNANTCDNDHGYGAEQAAFDGGLMDMFVQQTGCTDPNLGKAVVMGYFDGNTVTALWNYAQHFAISDDFFGSTFGPSTPGALNVVSGTTYAGTITNGVAGNNLIANNAASGAVINDTDPSYDKCSNPSRPEITMSGRNIGDLLNAAGISWGAFMGGFANCAAPDTGVSHTGVTGLTTADYIPHHAWFQYWTSTENPNHAPPSSTTMIGKTDQANHEYDLSDFSVALQNHNMPAVSYLKAIATQDGHAGYSDPLDEQIFLVNTINAIIKAGYWDDTAVIITWDDSDGWYDHQMGPIIRQSNVDQDELLGSGNCGTPKAVPGDGVQNGRCGVGPRIPLVVISAFARQNYIDHRVTDFSSIVRFIEDNWNLGRIGNGSGDAVAGKLNGMFDFDHRGDNPPVILDPTTGEIVSQGGGH